LACPVTVASWKNVQRSRLVGALPELNVLQIPRMAAATPRRAV
jgi:hypothetical protein